MGFSKPLVEPFAVIGCHTLLEHTVVIELEFVLHLNLSLLLGHHVRLHGLPLILQLLSEQLLNQLQRPYQSLECFLDHHLPSFLMKEEEEYVVKVCVLGLAQF